VKIDKALRFYGLSINGTISGVNVIMAIDEPLKPHAGPGPASLFVDSIQSE
jgi:hypothetical protein